MTKEATCSAEGVKTFTCECGDSYTESISKSAHNYSMKITADATGKDEGTKTYTCTCGDTYKETFLLSTTFKGFVDQLTAKYGSNNGFMGEEGAGEDVQTICKYVGFSTSDGIHFSVDYKEEYYDANDTPFQVNDATMKVELANNSFTVTAWY